MKLSREQTDKTLSFLESVWPDPKICPVCKSSAWNLLEMVFELRETGTTNGAAEDDTALPLVAIMCKRCGNTLLFNALAADILSTDNLQDV